ncbi:hypothetical protein ACFQZJ_15530 [Maribacter chungangensis]|uniref:Lipoprotein n=1 Tax=Maribacter chungangensis TaxID=1069117 RepID=A0ABW3B726_9FLAO
MKLTTLGNSVIFCVLLCFASCSGSEYDQLVKQEMASGIVHDSLLFDLKMGQSKDHFFKSCWKLNQKGIIFNGPGNTTVKYPLPRKKGETSTLDMTLLFFGDFNEEKIMTGMDLQFYYNSWSLWNKSLQAKQLVPVVMDTLKKWYPGNDFLKVPIKGDSLYLLVKVDGNRRITIPPITDQRIVTAKIDDLRYVLEEK